ncbi:MAG: hypothetical protein HQL69_21605 [Magnetococcales bacterium]|nr:hypothetical protein [Magnetococcales bacterium]
MSSQATVTNLLQTTLQTQLPNRIITRDFKQLQVHKDPDLTKGIYTIICSSESDYQNALGREAQGGRLQILLLAQLKAGPKATGSQVEDAEFTVIQEIKTFLRSPLPNQLGNLSLKSVQQSGQLEAPYGWVAANLELTLYD